MLAREISIRQTSAGTYQSARCVPAATRRVPAIRRYVTGTSGSTASFLRRPIATPRCAALALQSHKSTATLTSRARQSGTCNSAREWREICSRDQCSPHSRTVSSWQLLWAWRLWSVETPLVIVWGQYVSSDWWQVSPLPNWNNEPGIKYNSQRVSPSNFSMSSDKKPSIHTSPSVRASSLQNTESVADKLVVQWLLYLMLGRTVSDSNIRGEWEVSDAHFEGSFSAHHIDECGHDLFIHFWGWDFSCRERISQRMMTCLTRVIQHSPHMQLIQKSIAFLRTIEWGNEMYWIKVSKWGSNRWTLSWIRSAT